VSLCETAQSPREGDAHDGPGSVCPARAPGCAQGRRRRRSCPSRAGERVPGADRRGSDRGDRRGTTEPAHRGAGGLAQRVPGPAAGHGGGGPGAADPRYSTSTRCKGSSTHPPGSPPSPGPLSSCSPTTSSPATQAAQPVPHAADQQQAALLQRVLGESSEEYWRGRRSRYRGSEIATADNPSMRGGWTLRMSGQRCLSAWGHPPPGLLQVCDAGMLSGAWFRSWGLPAKVRALCPPSAMTALAVTSW
jgi:hypothetical protein